MKLNSNSMTTGAATLLSLIFAAAAYAAEPPAPATGDKATAPPTSTPAKRPEPKLSTSAQPRANTSGASAPASSAAQGNAQPKPAGARKTNDRIDLDTTVVSGNRELPKVLYIVPWKKADIGDLPAQPFNTLLDEVLTPVDRDVFRREVTYYGAIANGPDAATGAPVGSSPSSEK